MNNPFDQMVINALTKPSSSEHNRQFSQAEQSLRELINKLGWGLINADGTGLWSSGGGAMCIGDSFRAVPVPAPPFTIRLKSGYSFMSGAAASDIGGIVGLNDESLMKPLVLLADTDIVTPVSDANPRIDIIEVKYKNLLTDSATKLKLDPDTGIPTPTLVNTTLERILDGSVTVNGSGAINYKSGSPAANPVAPATSAGYVKVAEILMPPATTVSTWAHIADHRSQLCPDGVARMNLSWTQPSSTTAVSNVQFAGPPGFRFVIKTVSANQVDVYVLAPKNFTYGFGTAQAHTGSRIITGNSGGTTPVVGTFASSGDKTAIEGANTFPSGSLVLATNGAATYNGHRLFKFSFNVYTIDAGTGTIAPANATACAMTCALAFSQN